MIALLNMTNLWWEWVVAPMLLMSTGWWAREWFDGREERRLERQRVARRLSIAYGLRPSPPTHVRSLRRPYDWAEEEQS